jgi:hypothetical protein
MGLDRKSREGLQVNNIPRYVAARIHMTINRNLGSRPECAYIVNAPAANNQG